MRQPLSRLEVNGLVGIFSLYHKPTINKNTIYNDYEQFTGIKVILYFPLHNYILAFNKIVLN